MIPDIDLQLLATASQLAALENEIERGKQRLRGLLASGELPGSEAVEREKASPPGRGNNRIPQTGPRFRGPVCVPARACGLCRRLIYQLSLPRRR